MIKMKCKICLRRPQIVKNGVLVIHEQNALNRVDLYFCRICNLPQVDDTSVRYVEPSLFLTLAGESEVYIDLRAGETAFHAYFRVAELQSLLLNDSNMPTIATSSFTVPENRNCKTCRDALKYNDLLTMTEHLMNQYCPE